MHIGAEMRGGEIVVHGNAADWLGAEMHGGRIHVRGNAGHLVGAVYRGGRRGMTGGEILVDGNAGNEIGHTMRRGLIAIGGNAGDGVGFNMIAGSILVFGGAARAPVPACAAARSACSGRRAADAANLPAASVCRPVFLRFYLSRLREMGFLVRTTASRPIIIGTVATSWHSARAKFCCGSPLEMRPIFLASNRKLA